ncbi:MAG: UbiA family prenyltransferase [Halobacteriota archaeon]|nr:UbiA family prenyltransferase [Halobacteriota archaeon]
MSEELEEDHKIISGDKIFTLLEMSKPKIAIFMGFMAFAGAIFSPNFFYGPFPEVFYLEVLSLILPDWFVLLLSIPPVISLINAVGAGFIAALIWGGTALFNDYYDIEIDERTNPDRPLVKGKITPQETIFWAFCAYLLAILLVEFAGDSFTRFLVIAFVFLGFSYSANPIRLRRSGVMGSVIIGAAGALAFIGGSSSQYSISPDGILIAIVMGVLISATTIAKDFKDIEGDRESGVKTLPIALGYDSALKVMMVSVTASYIIAMLPYLLGFYSWSSSPVIIIVGVVNLLILGRLFNKEDIESKEKAYPRSFICHSIVLLVFLMARFLF